MRILVTILLVGLAACSSSDPPQETPSPTAPGGDPGPAPITTRTLATGLDTPWDMQLDPTGTLWVSERRGVISRVDTANGEVTAVATLDVVEISESGLLGLALHPQFTVEPFVYAVHSYEAGDIRNRLVRMRWDGATLGEPEILLDNIPGASNHDGARLAFGPDGFLYVTTGDALVTSLPQSLSSLAGKVLRLTPTGEPAPGNPFDSAIYSLGHRNAQGLVFHPSGRLYSTEHGPRDNDEVNLILPGRNYGWPNVHGFCDNDVSGLDESGFCASNNVAEPLVTWTPTIAPSGLDYYGSDRIAEWEGSLLFTSLRGAALYRLPLSTDGQAVLGQEVLFQGQFGRLRDVLVGPRGEVYLATSNRDGRGSPGPGDDRIVVVTR